MSPAGSNPSFAVRFRPVGPWRFGPDSGARERVDLLYHSDAVFSAVCAAMSQLGHAADWFEATAGNQAPAVRFSSFYPYLDDALLVMPPRSLWPPPESSKVRYRSARFVPLSVVEALLSDKGINEDQWLVDGESECLIPREHSRGPFRVSVRTAGGVDRVNPGKLETHSTACLEFARDAGLWTIVQFRDEDMLAQWEAPVRSALRLLADSGFGGERSRGWGRSEAPAWSPWLAPRTPALEESTERAHWLLSLYVPAAGDSVDWKRGNYSTVTRHGRIESSVRWGELKKPTLMIAEGSVWIASGALEGAVRDVAPDGFPHPVYRAGFAVAVSIPWRAAA
jgi:CRISPR type III-A-associated RAMP protein Csm4